MKIDQANLQNVHYIKLVSVVDSVWHPAMAISNQPPDDGTA